MKKGLIHLYTGDGKGKTTAALGLGIRACGAGMKVCVIQFLKGRESSELEVLRKNGIEVYKNTKDYGFYKNMSIETREIVRNENNANLKKALELMKDGVDVLVLDEIIAAYNHDIADKKLVMELIDKKAESVELVMTGRNAPEEIVNKCDYVTNMQCVKHPYMQGIGAREGIEY